MNDAVIERYFGQAHTSLLPAAYFGWYGLAVVSAVVFSALVWVRLVRSHTVDPRVPILYLAALVGAFIGAKVAFMFAYSGVMTADLLVSGKSVSGARLGGYGTVELGKRYLRYPGSTGDLFAVTVPIGIAIGRLGCILQGCCGGALCTLPTVLVSQYPALPTNFLWPAARVELLFQVGFLIWVWSARRGGWCVTNRFHVYLIAYGVFRFVHEFLRAEPRMVGPFSGYHFVAVALVMLGLLRWRAKPIAAPSIA